VNGQRHASSGDPCLRNFRGRGGREKRCEDLLSEEVGIFGKKVGRQSLSSQGVVWFLGEQDEFLYTYWTVVLKQRRRTPEGYAGESCELEEGGRVVRDWGLEVWGPSAGKTTPEPQTEL